MALPTRSDFARPPPPLYSEALRTGDPIKATVSWTQINIHDGPARNPRIWPEEPKDGFGFSDDVWAVVDEELLSAPIEQWATGYLEWVHARLMELAVVREWDTRPLVAARQWCLDAGLRFRLERPAKSSPGRSHKAILSFEIDAEGTPWVDLTIHDRAGNTVGRNVTASPGLTVFDFRRLGRRLSWIDAAQVRADDAYPGRTVPPLIVVQATVGDM